MTLGKAGRKHQLEFKIRNPLWVLEQMKSGTSLEAKMTTQAPQDKAGFSGKGNGAGGSGRHRETREAKREMDGSIKKPQPRL